MNAAAVFAKELAPSDLAIFMPGETLVPFEYYSHRTYRYEQAWVSAQVRDDALTAPGRLWLISSHTDPHEFLDLMGRIRAIRPEAGRRQLFGVVLFLFSSPQNGNSVPDKP